MLHHSTFWDGPIIRTGRMSLSHAEPVNRENQDVSNKRRLLHKREILRVVQDGIVLLQLLKHDIRPGRRPRRVHDLEAPQLQLVDRHAMDDGQVLHRVYHAINHLLEDGVPRGRGNGPLAELQPVGDVGPGTAIAAIELDAHHQPCLVAELLGNPDVDGSDGEGVGVGVDAAKGVEEEVAQHVGLHAHVGELVVYLGDLGTVAKVALDELVAVLVAYQRAVFGRETWSAQLQMSFYYYYTQS